MKAIMCNVGSTDKKIRIAVGLILFVILFAMQTWWWLAGGVILVTGLLDFCPLYPIFGINTCRIPEKWWK